MESIIQKDRSHCFLCGRNAHADYWGLDEHHVFEGANRKKSEKYGLKVYICHDNCHIFGMNSVHRNAEVDKALKRLVQKKAMEHYGWSTEDFRAIFHKNYV
jgi:hypothetical protein